jgi:hypothetical protein
MAGHAAGAAAAFGALTEMTADTPASASSRPFFRCSRPDIVRVLQLFNYNLGERHENFKHLCYIFGRALISINRFGVRA